MKPRLHLVPTNGLGNRILAVASARRLAAETEASLTVFWSRYEGLDARFADLFEPLPGVRMIEGGHKRGWRYRILSLPYRSQVSALPRILQEWLFRTIRGESALKRNAVRPGDLGDFAAGRHRLTSCQPFYRSAALDLAEWMPREPLRTEIGSFADGFRGSLVVGVHIRRGDNSIAARESPLEGFLREMDAEVAINPGVRFFVASDCAEARGLLDERYRGRILRREIVNRRDSLAGVGDALVDLWLLGETERILGGWHSTFSEVAGIRGGVPVDYVRRDKTTRSPEPS